VLNYINRHEILCMCFIEAMTRCCLQELNLHSSVVSRDPAQPISAPMRASICSGFSLDEYNLYGRKLTVY